MSNFKELEGKTIKSVNIQDDRRELDIFCEDGSAYRMNHEQDCCEDVWLDDIIGDSLEDLIGSPIVIAEERTNIDDAEAEREVKQKGKYLDESITWTFYELGTERARVTLRWCGTSNGYYSERVDFIKIKEGE